VFVQDVTSLSACRYHRAVTLKTGREIEDWLETVYGPVTRLGGGAHSRVFRLMAAGDGFGAGERIVKVYRRADGMNALEAGNMRRAGLGDWVIGTHKPWTDEPEVLVLRYFPGTPITANQIAHCLGQLGAFLRGLHQKRAGQPVDLEAVQGKLDQFRTSLNPEARPELRPLFEAVQTALGTGLLETPAYLCHLDLWRANVLYGAGPDDEGRVLVVDWGRSNWDDPARDYAIFMTGTLDQLPADDAVRTAINLVEAEGLGDRFPAYVALQTLHDLHWLLMRDLNTFQTNLDEKLPRALMVLEKAR
jgi:Phosphotransferase enzyme family